MKMLCRNLVRPVPYGTLVLGDTNREEPICHVQDAIRTNDSTFGEGNHADRCDQLLEKPEEEHICRPTYTKSCYVVLHIGLPVSFCFSP